MFYHVQDEYGNRLEIVVNQPGQIQPSGESAPTDEPAPLSAWLHPAATPSLAARSRQVFVGRDGLRSGWRFLLFVALWGLMLYLLGRGTHLLVAHNLAGIWGDALDESERLLAVFLAVASMMIFERRPFGAYGLPWRGAFGKNFWVGAIWGFAALCVLMLAIAGIGDFSVSGLALHGLRMWKFATFWAAFFLVVGLFEEFLFRGYPQFTLTMGTGFWPAAVLLSLIFGFTHLGNAHESWIGALAVVAIGLFFCLTLRRTGTLWFAVGFHASWDWGESYLYSIPDSGEVSPGHLLNSSLHGSHWITGGAVGPEGSVLAFVVLALTWIAFDRMYPLGTDGGRASSPVATATVSTTSSAPYS